MQLLSLLVVAILCNYAFSLHSTSSFRFKSVGVSKSNLKYANPVLNSFSIEELIAALKNKGVDVSNVKIPQIEYNKGGPLTDLVYITKEACDILSPMVTAFYEKISQGYGGGAQKIKSDATYFTIADGIVQHLLIAHLFGGNKFHQIVGEEDESKINIITKPFMVDELEVPEEFVDIVESTRDKIRMLANRIDSNKYKELTLFVDPIDGTREFATGKGECCSILVGFNDAKGSAVAGMIYRPLTSPPTWAAGAASENCRLGVLDKPVKANPNGLLITDTEPTKFITTLINELGYEKIPSLASGNRVLMLVEGKGGAYIRDTGGNAKWDTCAPQAVLDAYGGVLVKLSSFIKDQSLENYTYLKAESNLDFEPNKVTLTLSNAKDKSKFKKGETVIVSDVKDIKPYSNVQGLLALDHNNLDDLDRIHAAILKMKKDGIPPLYT